MIWNNGKADQVKNPLNEFKEEKEDLPEFGVKAKIDEGQADNSGLELKNYIKEMNKFLDEPSNNGKEANKNNDGDSCCEEEEDECMEEDLPKVSVEISTQVDRDDSVEEDDEIEESK